MCSVAVVVAFFICWAPFHTQRLVSAYANSAAAAAAAESELNNSTAATHVDVEQSTENVGELVFFYISGVLYYVSSVVNPILYNIMSVKFRQAFVDTILHCNCCRSRRGRAKMTGSRLTLGGDVATAAVRRYRFAAARDADPASSDAGSQRQRAAEEARPDEVRPLTSSQPDSGQQVRPLDAGDMIVLVDMHFAPRATSSAANCCQTSNRRWFT